MTKENIDVNLKDFADACDKMSQSKFIMIDKRISDVLKTIAKSDEIFDYIKDCMINFNFEKEWKLATARMGMLLIPEEPRKFVAFVFVLLNCLDDKKLNASDFLSKYFSKSESQAGPYNEFCQAVIQKFKNLVVAKLSNQTVSQVIVEEKKPKIVVNIDQEIAARLIFLAKDLKEYVIGLKKVKKSSITKGELIDIIMALINALQNGHYSYIKSFVLAIKAAKGKDQEIDRRLFEILDIVNKTFIGA